MYRLARLAITLNAPNRISLRRTIDSILDGCRRYNHEYSLKDDAQLMPSKLYRKTRHRWSVTYLKSPFKHRKAIRHYVFERYSLYLSFHSLGEAEVSSSVSIVLASLSPLVTAKCFFSWLYSEDKLGDIRNSTGALLIRCGISRNGFSNLVKLRKVDLCLYRAYSTTANVALSEPQKRLVKKLKELENALQIHEKDVNGIYIHGGVGQGKTMLMEEFYTNSTQPKMLIHFHRFMSQIQKKLHSLRTSSIKNPLDEVCLEIRRNARLICLDEFQVEHISDAMILKAIFDKLFSLGCTLVSTSNKSPDELYLGGLNRERFLPFIDTLKERCLIFNLDSKVDYRQTYSGLTHFYFPHKGFGFVKELISGMGKPPASENVSLQISPLKAIIVPYQIYAKDGKSKLAIFPFDALFRTPSGTNEYIKLCTSYSVIGISEIPQFNIDGIQSDHLTRFIKFIDIAYESCVKIVFDSSKPLYQMFGQLNNNKLFEKLGRCLLALGIKPSDNLNGNSLNELLASKLDRESINKAVKIVNAARKNSTFSDALWTLIQDNAIYYSEDSEFVEGILKLDYSSIEISSPISFIFDDGLENYPRTLSRIRHMASREYWGC